MVVGIALGCGLNDRGVRFPAGAGNFSLHHRVQTGSGAHAQPPIQLVPAALSLWVKRQRRDADPSPPSNTQVKNEWSYTSTPTRLHGVVLT
jgi:hypothetical protein